MTELGCGVQVANIFVCKNGDLSKPTSTAMGRARATERWQELRQQLNADPTGDPRLIDKWKK
ncbi:Uncharacterized protein OBRU01_24945, partial [Operophtera brumata]